MSNIHTILTHPGSAHKDEFLACSILLALYPVPVVRREPTAEDLADENICVVDVGHEHAPARQNFDHHQLPKDHPPTCSISLILKHLGIYEDARTFCEWLEVAEWFDTRGPSSTARWLGVKDTVVSRLYSPIDGTLLRRFALAERLQEGDPIWAVMRMIGEDLLGWIKGMRHQLNFIAAHAEFWELPTDSGPLHVLFMPRTDPMPAEPSQGLARFIESRGMGSSVAGLIYPDRRGGGYGLSRFDDDARLDFTRIASYNDVHFTHARGFIAKTSATDLGQLKKLMLGAWVPQ